LRQRLPFEEWHNWIEWTLRQLSREKTKDISNFQNKSQGEMDTFIMDLNSTNDSQSP